MPPQILYYQNTQVFYVSNVQNLSGTYLSGASGIVTLIDTQTQTALAGQTWPLTLSYLSATSGDYRGTLSAALRMTPSQRVTAQVTFTIDDAKGYWEVPLVVRLRDGS